MGFASAWLEEKAIFPEIIKEAPDLQTGIIVVIPAYNEPGISRVLDSLVICDEPDCKIEVIIVVNAPEGAVKEHIDNNKQTILNIESWKNKNKNCFFRLFAFNAESSIKGWGVGLARKTGMDEAIRRFNKINYPEGIILNLDADCQVEKNYFVSVCNDFLKRKEKTACSVYFEHPLSGDDFPESVYKSIILYELHLRYYYQGLACSGFPFVFHTVGSAVAVRALNYIKAGGMNRRQAGEDFYFIQKLVPAGGYFSLNSTTVYPSPRASFRVPFGTGASITKLTAGNNSTLLTYNIRAFLELRLFFANTEQYFSCRHEELAEYYSRLPEGLKLFLNEKEWIEKISEIRNNTSGLSSFKKRFFGWFNMFRIMKYLNYVHLNYFEKIAVEVSAMELLEVMGIIYELLTPLDLLNQYRAMEKNS
jgi:cellulose synthase/poly-beta-1,6-N-acetylglucosamine synthase-like glycosyltransferase